MVHDDRYFAWHGGAVGALPVVLAVPHAGRDYPATLLAQARVPVAVLRGLEDRYADRLVARAVLGGYPVLVATTPRALVDLNRDPDDRLDDGHGAAPCRAVPGGRAAVGMGVFPQSMPSVGGLWRGAVDPSVLDDRIVQIHRPYHATLAAALGQVRGGHGIAVLLDIHSMPRRAGRGWPCSADIVLGDCMGKSAAQWLVMATEEIVRSAGLSCARNTPYSGGYATACHGDPAAALHAIQIEVARDLYLHGDGTPIMAGIERVGGVIEAVADRLSMAAGAATLPDAAE